MTSTLIVGNGLGMALNPNHFNLQTGLTSAWNHFNDAEKHLISLGTNNRPAGEENLEENHKIMTACHKLLEFQELELLNEIGINYPDLYRDFIFNTALHFFNYEGNLPVDFVESLIGLIQRGCHVATLNYDKLLYSALVERHILSGYDGDLVDGIYNSGYHYENMLRTFHHFNWYLHIHGCPIFYTKNSEIHKCKYYEVPDSTRNLEEKYEHIVLAKTELKPEIISNSSILGSYFNFFSKALFESTRLFIFGYSGEDIHINNEIKNWALDRSTSFEDTVIYIIQWRGSQQNELHWKQRIIPNMRWENKERITLHYIPLDNILEYRFPE